MSDLQEVIARWKAHLSMVPDGGITAIDKAGLTRLLDAAEANEALEAAQAWRPIETAPKDGTWVLVTWAENAGSSGDDEGSQPAVVAQWTTLCNGMTVKGHWQFAWFDGGYYGHIYQPTHWMPLPPPPGGDNE